MRRTGALSAIAIAGILVAVIAARAQEPGDVGALQKVRNNLFVIPGQGGNTAVFVTRTGVVLVDTKNPGNGQAILDRVAAVSDEPVSMIINTHTHGDHVGSNEFFAASVEVVTHENTRANMNKMPEVREKPQAMPDRTFRDRLTIGSGQDRVELYYFGPAHTNGDAFVVFPAVRAMHAGDVFPSKNLPLVDTANGGSAAAYADTLDKAVAGIRGVDTVIPGHSAVTTWGEFAAYARYVREAMGNR
jgi:glyoxylase-like metal-dependent hydrolase (beta-lactamase superfamily II)